MSERPPVEPFVARWTSAWITVVLVLAVVVHVGFRVSLGLGQADVDRYESPLMLSVARQLLAGPWELYGPFGGSNPLVLIHAPLYYRAAGLLAWPMWRAGLHPVEAARIAGRLISALGLAATLLAAYRLGRLGGRSRRAGWWAMLLLAASPVLAGQPFAVRPDMAGVALQTWGAVLVLESLAGPGRRPGWGSLLFGLAACVKQHLVGAWAVSAALVAVEWVARQAAIRFGGDGAAARPGGDHGHLRNRVDGDRGTDLAGGVRGGGERRAGPSRGLAARRDRRRGDGRQECRAGRARRGERGRDVATLRADRSPSRPRCSSRRSPCCRPCSSSCRFPGSPGRSRSPRWSR